MELLGQGFRAGLPGGNGQLIGKAPFRLIQLAPYRAPSVSLGRTLRRTCCRDETKDAMGAAVETPRRDPAMGT